MKVTAFALFALLAAVALLALPSDAALTRAQASALAQKHVKSHNYNTNSIKAPARASFKAEPRVRPGARVAAPKAQHATDPVPNSIDCFELVQACPAGHHCQQLLVALDCLQERHEEYPCNNPQCAAAEKCAPNSLCEQYYAELGCFECPPPPPTPAPPTPCPTPAPTPTPGNTTEPAPAGVSSGWRTATYVLAAILGVIALAALLWGIAGAIGSHSHPHHGNYQPLPSGKRASRRVGTSNKWRRSQASMRGKTQRDVKNAPPRSYHQYSRY